MKRLMLIGRTYCGKTSFCQAFYDMTIKYKKTQSIEIMNDIIDTPGEYMENRSLYRALSVTSADADLIGLMQACNDKQSMFAPSFSTMFNGKLVFGIVSKIDLAKDEEEIIRAEKSLKLAGAEKIFRLSSTSGIGINEIRDFLIRSFDDDNEE